MHLSIKEEAEVRKEERMVKGSNSEKRDRGTENVTSGSTWEISQAKQLLLISHHLVM